MSAVRAPRARARTVSQALARDRLGVPAVLFFVLAGVAPLTVAAGVIPTAYATTGLTGIPVAFLAVAVILGIFAVGYVAMARHVTSAGAFYAFVSQGIGKVAGVAAALIALLAYTCLQVGLYGALGPAAEAEGAAHLGLHAPWWAWALVAWAVIAVLGLLRVDITGWVLGVLLTAEITVILAETVSGLASPASGHLSFATLSPADLTSAGVGTFGVLAVVAVLGFVGFEQAPVLAEEARNPRRTIPLATYLALGMIAVVYAGASWAMAANVGTSHVIGAATKEGPGLLFGLGDGFLSETAQFLFMTSLFAAALAFHNVVWRYMFALGREHVLPPALGRTGANNIPKAASLVQSASGFAVIVLYAATGQDPMSRLFFWLGTTGGFGILLLLTLTSVAVIVFFVRNPESIENIWQRLIAPALAAVALGVIVVLAVRNYATLLGVPRSDAASWALPASYAVVAAIGLGWGLLLRTRRPDLYAAIGDGPHAAATRLASGGTGGVTSR
jgi:amino acid transporter